MKGAKIMEKTTRSRHHEKDNLNAMFIVWTIVFMVESVSNKIVKIL
ncbi:hypothetical protein SPB_0887 [Streptococcus parauberis NCFD 2020]|uniref:Uncharacterized protein n=1 Tax=Streptococcus parauberis NCFD 2020 TaxID=873447 RepID=F1Z1T6_9STRE|nr:hypothetical protein SPB_0887 [Streptococcus parauberis NCFD 2020]